MQGCSGGAQEAGHGGRGAGSGLGLAGGWGRAPAGVTLEPQSVPTPTSQPPGAWGKVGWVRRRWEGVGNPGDRPKPGRARPRLARSVRDSVKPSLAPVPPARSHAEADLFVLRRPSQNRAPRGPGLEGPRVRAESRWDSAPASLRPPRCMPDLKSRPGRAGAHPQHSLCFGSPFNYWGSQFQGIRRAGISGSNLQMRKASQGS